MDFFHLKMETISKEMLDILACPVCKGDLEQKNGLFCKKCNHTYQIKDGIPVLMPPDA